MQDPTDVVSIEISALVGVGDTDNKLVLLDSDVTSETITIKDTVSQSGIVSAVATGAGVLYISNNSTDMSIWYAVGLNPDPSTPGKRRLLKAGRDASIAIKINEKVAIRKAFDVPTA